MPFYRILRMGCGVSKIDANGVATPNRSILPNFPTRKKQSTKFIPPKKEPMLLMPENDDRPSISVPKCDVNNLNCVNPEASKEENDEKRVAKIKTMVEEAEKHDERGRLHEDEGEGSEEEDGNDDDQRAINKVRVGEEDDNDFPSSPSFRVYFTDKDVETNNKDDGYNKVGLKDVTPVATTISPTKNSESESEPSMEKEEKKEIRKRSTFRNVLPKNLLNVRSSSNSSTRSTHQYHHKVAS
ncbi:uncharacterized protein LOC129901029 [Solanum dulcamara]|uniref:uncharacterized protein LOC129901029 n=1 Tax=Solanum dulcamara TaxID=45834 RepID=UPI002486350D|nr:uncharacterized protein LOC129901029 [Solanum dulcamara]